MINELLKYVKIFKGNVITIGVKNEKIISKLMKKNNINLFEINESPGNGIFRRKSKKKLNKGKTINIKKLYKTFNKKSIDYIICNVDEVKYYLKYFIKNSIYINSNKLYIYGNIDDIDIDILKKRYKRYNVSIEEIIIGNEFILIIDNTKSKNKKIMELFYFIKDSLYNLVDFISNILIS